MAVATVYRRQGPTWMLRCPCCDHRIAWTSHDVWRSRFELIFNDPLRLAARERSKGTPDGTPIEWDWQSRPPMRWRQDGTVVDIKCQHCGWTANDVSYPEGLEPYMVKKAK
jgi:hypothetical protein